MDIRRITQIIQAHKLSDAMVGALFTGEDGKAVEAGPKQVTALSERTLLHPESRILTDQGSLLLRALRGEVLSPDEELAVFPVSGSKSGGERLYFVDWTTTPVPQIRLIADSDGSEIAVSLAEAKETIINDALVQRDRYRNLIKETRALRAKDLHPIDTPLDEEDEEVEE
jgi:hypothetical protein